MSESPTPPAEIVNLRRRRKERARLEKKKRAEENRLQFGRRTSERKHQRALQNQEKARLEGHFRQKPETPEHP